MSNDLISRSALLKAMGNRNKYNIAKEQGFIHIGLTEGFLICEDIIHKQPIAYDVDKVAALLEDLELHNNDNHKDNPCKFTEGYGCAIDKAIEIVKAGGVDA